MDALRIDIISDVVCPWCYIGFRQLERALAATGTKADIHWHPFELNPKMPAGGQDLSEHLAEKYGTTPAQSETTRNRISALGREVGIRFEWGDDMRMLNTFDAHRLIHWAEGRGRAQDVKLALFEAYFTEGADISDHETLALIAAINGLPKADAKAMLASKDGVNEVRAAEKEWTEAGVSSVPSVILDERFLINGAQGVQGYTNLLTRLRNGSLG